MAHQCPFCDGDCECDDLICSHLCLQLATDAEVVDTEQARIDPDDDDVWDEAHDDE